MICPLLNLHLCEGSQHFSAFHLFIYLLEAILFIFSLGLLQAADKAITVFKDMKKGLGSDEGRGE